MYNYVYGFINHLDHSIKFTYSLYASGFFFFFVKLESHSTFKKRVHSYINT